MDLHVTNVHVSMDVVDADVVQMEHVLVWLVFMGKHVKYVLVQIIVMGMVFAKKVQWLEVRIFFLSRGGGGGCSSSALFFGVNCSQIFSILFPSSYPPPLSLFLSDMCSCRCAEGFTGSTCEDDVATLPIKPLSPGDPCPPMTQCALPAPAPEPMMIEEIIVDPVTKKEKTVSVPDVEVVRHGHFFVLFFSSSSVLIQKKFFFLFFF